MYREKQTKGLDYWNTYIPVVKSITIRLIIVLAIINSWNYRYLDYILAYTQALYDSELCIKTPTSFHIKNANREEYYLK